MSVQLQAFDFSTLPDRRMHTFRSYIRKFKHENNYREAEGDTCVSCRHSVVKSFQTAAGTKSKLKCAKLGITNSQKTDISSYNICNLWE